MLSEGLVAQVRPGPVRPTLVFDGSCAFCRRWVGRIQRWDRRNAISYLRLQDAAAESVSGRRRKDLERAVHLVRRDGAVFAGAAAARELFAELPGGRVLSGAMRLPGAMAVAARAYAWVARRFGPVADGPSDAR